jgi:hypothetical protein
MERVIVDRFGDRDVLVATKEGMLVVLVPAELGDVVVGGTVPVPHGGPFWR